jgi:hypothetical protein
MHNGQQDEEGMPRALAAPVGSAKFGARVGGLVSPTLVGAGVAVVGAAHAPSACGARAVVRPNRA